MVFVDRWSLTQVKDHLSTKVSCWSVANMKLRTFNAKLKVDGS